MEENILNVSKYFTYIINMHIQINMNNNWLWSENQIFACPSPLEP